MRVLREGASEPCEMDGEELVRLATSGVLKKDALIWEEGSGRWVRSGEHPLTAGLYPAYSPRLSSTAAPKPAGRLRASVWVGLAAFLAITFAGVFLHLFLYTDPSALLSFAGRAALLAAIVTALAFFFGRFSLLTRRGLPLALAAGATSLLLGISLAMEVPTLRSEATQRAYRGELQAIDGAVRNGTMRKRTYAALEFGAYAPFLNLLNTMAYDYEEEVAAYHRELSAVLLSIPDGPEFLKSPDTIEKAIQTLESARQLCHQHRSHIEDRLLVYRLRFEALPYKAETKSKLMAQYDLLRTDAETMVADYFGNIDGVVDSLERLLRFFKNNPQAFRVTPRGFRSRRRSGTYGFQNLPPLVSSRLVFSDRRYNSLYREYLGDFRQRIRRDAELQQGMNEYYANRGRQLILSLETIAGEEAQG